LAGQAAPERQLHRRCCVRVEFARRSITAYCAPGATILSHRNGSANH
jgi:hypothetical protein